MKDVPFAALQYIIDLIYDGRVSVRTEHLDDFLAAAKYLQISGFYDNDPSILSNVSVDSDTTMLSDETTDSSNISDSNCSKSYCHELNLNSSKSLANCGNYIKLCNEKTKSAVTIPLQKRKNSDNEASTSSKKKTRPEDLCNDAPNLSQSSSSDEMCK